MIKKYVNKNNRYVEHFLNIVFKLLNKRNPTLNFICESVYFANEYSLFLDNVDYVTANTTKKCLYKIFSYYNFEFYSSEFDNKNYKNDFLVVMKNKKYDIAINKIKNKFETLITYLLSSNVKYFYIQRAINVFGMFFKYMSSNHYYSAFDYENSLINYYEKYLLDNENNLITNLKIPKEIIVSYYYLVSNSSSYNILSEDILNFTKQIFLKGEFSNNRYEITLFKNSKMFSNNLINLIKISKENNENDLMSILISFYLLRFISYEKEINNSFFSENYNEIKEVILSKKQMIFICFLVAFI